MDQIKTSCLFSTSIHDPIPLPASASKQRTTSQDGRHSRVNPFRSQSLPLDPQFDHNVTVHVRSAQEEPDLPLSKNGTKDKIKSKELESQV